MKPRLTATSGCLAETLCLLLFVLLVPNAHSGTFSVGDVLVGGRPPWSIGGGQSFVDRFSPTGVYQEHTAVLTDGHPRDMLSIGNDVVVANQSQLTRIAPDGSTSLFSPLYFGNFIASLAADARGNIYAADLLGNRVAKISPNGNLLASFFLQGSFIIAMDLMSDQCTLLYVISGSAQLHAYDLCANKPLANFAQLPSSGFVRRGHEIRQRWSVCAQLLFRCGRTPYKPYA